MRRPLLALSIIGFPIVVNASGTSESIPEKRLNPREFVEYFLKNADDAKIPAGRDAKLFGLPSEGDSIPIKGDSSDPGELGVGRQSSCELILKRVNGALRPHCLLIVIDENHQKEHRVYGHEFQFDLSGRLQNAAEVHGELDSSGQGIEGTGFPTRLNVKDPSIVTRAKAELNFWLERTARAIAKKRAHVNAGGGVETAGAAAQAR